MSVSQETIVRQLVRLRRAERRSGDEDVATVRTELERIAGPTIRRAAAARLLGVSQTALDRWIAAGDIPVVIAPAGRREVPVPALVTLLDRVDARRERGEPNPLAAELRSRRVRAAAIDVDSLLAGIAPETGPHRGAELRALAYHRAVARLIDDELVADAGAQLRRWQAQGRLHPRYAGRWAQLLASPRDELLRALGDDEEHAADLRQNSPFAGLLDEPARQRALDAVAHSAAA